MSRGYNTTAQHTLKEQALKIMAERCHKGVRMAQIMPSTTWLDVKVLAESAVYNQATSFFAYEIQNKRAFESAFASKYESIFHQAPARHFNYAKTDITLEDKSEKFREQAVQQASHRPVLKFDLGFYDLCACYYRFPMWFTEKHWNRFTRDADILFTFDLDKNGRTAGKRDYPTLIREHFANTTYPKVKYDLAMFELWERQNKSKLTDKINAIVNCMRIKGLFTDTVCVYQDCGSVMGVFHCRKIRGFYRF